MAGGGAKESAAGAAIPILSQPLTYIDTSELLAWVVTDATSSDEDWRYVRNESYSGFNSEGFRRSPADPKKKKNLPAVVKEVFICAHHTAAASHFDWPPPDRNSKLTNSTEDPVPLIRREPQCRTSL